MRILPEPHIEILVVAPHEGGTLAARGTAARAGQAEGDRGVGDGLAKDCYWSVCLGYGVGGWRFGPRNNVRSLNVCRSSSGFRFCLAISSFSSLETVCRSVASLDSLRIWRYRAIFRPRRKSSNYLLLPVFSMLIHPRIASEPFMLSSTDRAVRAGKEHWHGPKPRRIRFVPGLDTTSCFRAPDHHCSHPGLH